MKTVWLLVDVTKTPKLYFTGFYQSTIALNSNPTSAKRFESEYHANCHLTFDMKHSGLVAKQVQMNMHRVVDCR